jgi:hypothetical protein
MLSIALTSDERVLERCELAEFEYAVDCQPFAGRIRFVLYFETLPQVTLRKVEPVSIRFLDGYYRSELFLHDFTAYESRVMALWFQCRIRERNESLKEELTVAIEQARIATAVPE